METFGVGPQMQESVGQTGGALFEPQVQGTARYDQVNVVTSVIDFAFRAFAVNSLGRSHLMQTPTPRGESESRSQRLDRPPWRTRRQAPSLQRTRSHQHLQPRMLQVPDRRHKHGE